LAWQMRRGGRERADRSIIKSSKSTVNHKPIARHSPNFCHSWEEALREGKASLSVFWGVYTVPRSPLSRRLVKCCPHTMLLPKGGVTWKSTKARLPPSRAIVHFLTRSRFPLFLTLAGVVLILWRGISTSASEMQR